MCLNKVGRATERKEQEGEREGGREKMTEMWQWVRRRSDAPAGQSGLVFLMRRGEFGPER